MTIGGRRPSGKTTFGGRQPLLEENLWWKTTIVERRPSVVDDLRWKMTLSGRQPSLDPCMLPTPLSGIFSL